MKIPDAQDPSGVPPTGGTRNVLVAAALLMLLSAGGFVALEFVRAWRLGVPAPFSHGIFYFLFEQHEKPFLLVQALFTVLVLVVVRRSGPVLPVHLDPFSRPWPRWLVIVFAGATAALAVVGTKTVFHDTPLTMDELAPEFQARILRQGKLEAELPAEWKAFGRALSPVGITFTPGDGSWRSLYLPGYAAIRALFLTMGLPSGANPALAALTVLGIAAAASRLWPGNARAISFALVFLLTSSQFLVNSMTFYSMPAHLCLNVWWLYLYLRGDRAGLLLLPWVGALALLLHNPVPHALFAAPFLLRFLLSRRPAWCAYFVGVYSGAIALMFFWYRTSSEVTQVGDYLRVFAGSTTLAPLIQLMSVTLVFTWQSPFLAVAFLLGIVGWRELGPTQRDLCLGIVLTLLVHAVFPSHQGHGWGYRYVYAVLGNIVLLGVAGAVSLTRSARAVNVLMVAAVTIAAGFQLPLRALQAEAFVTPYARGVRAISSLSAEVVVVDTAGGWYAQDLVRNDPFLRNTPKVLHLRGLTSEQRTDLSARSAGRVSFVGASELARFGLPAWRFVERPHSGP